MSELRWTLLILGVVFIAALTWWERRRPRQAFAPRLREASPSHGDGQRLAGADPAAAREPWIGEAGLSDVILSDTALTDAAEVREPARDSGVRAHAEPSGPGPLEELPTLIIPDVEEPLALEATWEEEEPSEPTPIDPQMGGEAADALEAVMAAEPAEAVEPRVANAAAVPPAIPGAGAPGPDVVSGRSPPRDTPPEPIVDWPPEESRRILALRLVAPQPERFSGRTLRLALAAEGFLLGKFSIFHKPDESNRAALSAASLTRPGAFDLETMDSQRYGGLSLFAVLPGPLTPPQVFEELLATARNLNERLQGALQDERGSPLTPLRVASLRDSLRAEAATVAAASAHET